MIYALIIFVVTLAIKLAVDVRLWLRGKPNQHTIGAAIVLCVLVICSWLAGWRSTDVWSFGYWAAFDTLYATLIGQKWYWTGTTARLDKLQARWPWLKVVKYTGVPVSIICYLL